MPALWTNYVFSKVKTALTVRVQTLLRTGKTFTVVWLTRIFSHIYSDEQEKVRGDLPEPAAKRKQQLLVHTEKESFCYNEWISIQAVAAVTEHGTPALKVPVCVTVTAHDSFNPPVARSMLDTFRIPEIHGKRQPRPAELRRQMTTEWEKQFLSPHFECTALYFPNVFNLISIHLAEQMLFCWCL